MMESLHALSQGCTQIRAGWFCTPQNLPAQDKTTDIDDNAKCAASFSALTELGSTYRLHDQFYEVAVHTAVDRKFRVKRGCHRRSFSDEDGEAVALG